MGYGWDFISTVTRLARQFLCILTSVNGFIDLLLAPLAQTEGNSML